MKKVRQQWFFNKNYIQSRNQQSFRQKDILNSFPLRWSCSKCVSSATSYMQLQSISSKVKVWCILKVWNWSVIRHQRGNTFVPLKQHANRPGCPQEPLNSSRERLQPWLNDISRTWSLQPAGYSFPDTLKGSVCFKQIFKRLDSSVEVKTCLKEKAWLIYRWEENVKCQKLLINEWFLNFMPLN